jgi:hypothetical protein
MIGEQRLLQPFGAYQLSLIAFSRPPSPSFYPELTFACLDTAFTDKKILARAVPVRTVRIGTSCVGRFTIRLSSPGCVEEIP